MHRHKHLFDQVVSFENVLVAAREALRGKRARQPGASFYADLEKHVVDLPSELSGGDVRRRLKEQGKCVKEKLSSLHLRMHPDKYCLIPTRPDVDFVGFVVHADGRVRVRTATARRFQKRFRDMRWEVGERQQRASCMTTSVRAWIAHVKHAHSLGLRRAVLSR